MTFADTLISWLVFIKPSNHAKKHNQFATQSGCDAATAQVSWLTARMLRLKLDCTNISPSSMQIACQIQQDPVVADLQGPTAYPAAPASLMPAGTTPLTPVNPCSSSMPRRWAAHSVRCNWTAS